MQRPPRLSPVVLFIEDSLDQLELYEFALGEHYQVRKATHGERGVEVAIAEQPDVVLVDICMPGIDGWEVCRRLKSEPRTAAIPIILLTALDGKDTAERAMQVGAAALLMKPCNVDTLREEIEAATHARGDITS
jgi:CheY-like chemotaxis protein